ncbi:MAG TPA: hypothetical protein VEB64_16030 [Azospirillaceae bacterium]|nr:hypothetical protein [Azospirillaceae bacterium]
MTRKFTPVWGDDSSVVRAGTRPAAAGADTDAESAKANESRHQALFALKVMLDRGLIPPGEYERRRAAILAG